MANRLRTVVAILSTVQGDGDLNRTINFQDFVLLSTNLSAIESGWAQGNFNLDDIINFTDFVALANNHKTTAPGSGTASGDGTITPK